MDSRDTILSNAYVSLPAGDQHFIVRAAAASPCSGAELLRLPGGAGLAGREPVALVASSDSSERGLLPAKLLVSPLSPSCGSHGAEVRPVQRPCYESVIGQLKGQVIGQVD